MKASISAALMTPSLEERSMSLKTVLRGSWSWATWSTERSAAASQVVQLIAPAQLTSRSRASAANSLLSDLLPKSKLNPVTNSV